MTQTSDEMRTGVIGLGPMGSALADAILARHFGLRVWNRSADKCERFADVGARVCDCVESLIEESDLIIVCLADHAASMEVLQSATVTQRLSGKTLVLLSTMTAEESLATAEWADGNAIDYLEGAILGYPNDVRDKGCMFVYSGSKNVYQACEVVLNAMGGMPRLVGDRAGIATCIDKAIYSAYYAHVVGLIHGAAICDASGASLEVFIEAITTGSWDWKAHDAGVLDRIRRRDYSPDEATLKVHAAAYDLIAPLSEGLGVGSELPRVIAGYFASALKRGYESSELPVLFEVIKNDD
jgi:3-hydroxyisobutyrate dehydrogenase-like beta-hydroxyacid dehydrogenase